MDYPRGPEDPDDEIDLVELCPYCNVAAVERKQKLVCPVCGLIVQTCCE